MLNKFIMLLVLLGMFAFCGCSYFDYADDESDYAPGVHDVVGCWVSTENLSVDVKVDKTTMYKLIINTSM